MSKVHELKCVPEMFEAIVSRDKTFEVRQDDRGFKTGDVMILKEWDPEKEVFSGQFALVYISYILRRWPGIREPYIVMAIKFIGIMSE